MECAAMGWGAASACATTGGFDMVWIIAPVIVFIGLALIYFAFRPEAT